MFICHPDFVNLTPINVYHKEMDPTPVPTVPEQYQNRHILFRKKFDLANTENANLKITADPNMVWTLDGEREDGHAEVLVENLHHAIRLIK